MQTCETVNEHDSSELSLTMHCDLTGDYLQIPSSAGSHHCIMPKCSKHNHKHNGMIVMKILLSRMLDVEHIYDMSTSLYKYSCFCTCWHQNSTNCAILPSQMGEHGVRRYWNRPGHISSLVVFTMPVGKTIKSISSKSYAPGEPDPESAQNGKTSS